MEKNLNYYKLQTRDLCKQKKWENVSNEDLWMFLTEELGELAGAVRRNNNQFQDRKKTSIEGELMDVMSYMFQIADNLELDLDKIWNNCENVA